MHIIIIIIIKFIIIIITCIIINYIVTVTMNTVVVIIIVIIIIIDSVVRIVAVLWEGRRRNSVLISGSVEGFSCFPKYPSGTQVHPASHSTGGASYKVAGGCI